jgi:hypothetical protein
MASQDTTNTISPTDYEVAAQFAHFFTAAFLVTESARFGWKGLVIGSVGMFVFGAVKEFWWDWTRENPLVRGSSLLDFLMYTAGNALAVGLSFIH